MKERSRKAEERLANVPSRTPNSGLLRRLCASSERRASASSRCRSVIAQHQLGDEPPPAAAHALIPSALKEQRRCRSVPRAHRQLRVRVRARAFSSGTFARRKRAAHRRTDAPEGRFYARRCAWSRCAGALSTPDVAPPRQVDVSCRVDEEERPLPPPPHPPNYKDTPWCALCFRARLI